MKYLVFILLVISISCSKSKKKCWKCSIWHGDTSGHIISNDTLKPNPICDDSYEAMRARIDSHIAENNRTIKASGAKIFFDTCQ